MSTSSSSNPSSQHSSYQDGPQLFHRGRNIKSCLECRRRKMRCSRSQPCQNCVRFSRECQYFSSPKVTSPSYTCGRNGKPARPDAAEEKCPKVHKGSATELRWAGKDIDPSSNLSIPGNTMDPLTNREDHHTSSMERELGTEDLRIGRLKINNQISGLSRSQLARRVRYIPLSILFSVCGLRGLPMLINLL